MTRSSSSLKDVSRTKQVVENMITSNIRVLTAALSSMKIQARCFSVNISAFRFTAAARIDVVGSRSLVYDDGAGTAGCGPSCRSASAIVLPRQHRAPDQQLETDQSSPRVVSLAL